MTPPRVFISYSHDSAEHKSWVLDFASTLRKRGIDVVLDQWDLSAGDDLPHFMEQSLESCDYVIVVCTEKYVTKANAGSGGVAYEKMILTSTMLKTIDKNQIIPIVREASANPVPTFLSSKVFIDFSKDEEIEYSLDELIRTLLNAPLYEKPEIGENPFAPLAGSKPDRTSDGIKEVMRAIANASSGNVYGSASLPVALKRSSMHALVFRKYLSRAIEDGLLATSYEGAAKVTDKGYEYLVKHGILDD